MNFLARQQDHQLVLAPAGVFFAQRQDALGQCGGPSGLADLARTILSTLFADDGYFGTAGVGAKC